VLCMPWQAKWTHLASFMPFWTFSIVAISLSNHCTWILLAACCRMCLISSRVLGILVCPSAAGWETASSWRSPYNSDWGRNPCIRAVKDGV
jgi:hypothetical protein